MEIRRANSGYNLIKYLEGRTISTIFQVEDHFFTVWNCVSSETLVTDTLHPCITLCLPQLAPGITNVP